MSARWSIAAVIFVSVTLAAVAVAVWSQQTNSSRIARVAMSNCRAIEHLKAYAYSTAVRSLKTLPTLAYYKQHPDELKPALTQVREQRDYFAPQTCP